MTSVQTLSAKGVHHESSSRLVRLGWKELDWSKTIAAVGLSRVLVRVPVTSESMLREAERKGRRMIRWKTKAVRLKGGSRRRGGAWTTPYGIDRLRTDREFELTMEEDRGHAEIGETCPLFRDF